MASPKKTIILMVCVLAYMAFGMLVFYHIERPHEEQLLKDRIPLENFTAKFKGKYSFDINVDYGILFSECCFVTKVSF